MDIKIYTTPTCSYCSQAKHFLGRTCGTLQGIQCDGRQM
ncbi:MAG: hypothetical protein IIA48_08775 [Bacteroidetes bacterium]|nr:hypothetical protein [Bacteroidota bacterium]